jgi:hypothetical protein
MNPPTPKKMKNIAFCGGKNKDYAARLKKVYLLTIYKNYGLGWQQYLCPIHKKVLSKGRNVLKKIFLDIANTGNIQTAIQGHVIITTDLITNAHLHLILYLYHSYKSRGDSVPK